MHDRVPDNRDFEDVVGSDPGSLDKPRDQSRQGGPDDLRHLPRPTVMEHRVRDAAHEILAKADLGVHHAIRGEDRAIAEVGEMGGDRRRAHVDRNPVRRFMEARPDRGDVAAIVDGDRYPVIARLERRLQRADRLEVDVEANDLPLIGERRQEPAEIAARRRQRRRLDLDVVERHDRIDHERPNGEILADDLPMDLALDGNVDEDVAADLGDAAQASVAGHSSPPPVVELESGLGRQVRLGRRDAVLREFADPLLDLAATTQPVAAAHGIDVDPQRPRRVEDRGAFREAAAPPRRREDDEGFGLSG